MTRNAVENVALMGARGCGKSTIGRLLATRVGWTFVDLDDCTAARLAAASAGEALTRYGDAEFRNAEGYALIEAMEGTHQVIAMGGGAPMGTRASMALANRRIIARYARTTTVYLRVDADELLRRLSQDRTLRPSLTGAGALEEIQSVLAEREPIYVSFADYVINATQGTPATVVDAIMLAITR